MKKIMFTLAFGLLISAFYVSAQSTEFIVIGIVKDQYGEVPLAEISLKQRFGKSPYGKQVTGADGIFIMKVPHAINQIIVERKEYQSEVISVENPDYKDTIKIEVILKFYTPLEIETPSIQEESILDAPNTSVVITAEEIKNRGYVSIDEILYDIPGFDVVGVNGSTYINAYQRGYRTPFTQRTLLMVNGKVDNNLYAHTAELDRQYPLGNIKQIEVIYGPAGAVYGPNAFLGVINLITYDGQDLKRDTTLATASVRGGSFNSYGAELSLLGKKDDFSFGFSGTFYSSDEANLSDRWGFASNRWYSDSLVWGPILNQENNNKKFGEYYDPSNGLGFMGNITFKNTKFEFLHWDKRNGYGAYYAADRVQNNAKWYFISSRASIEHKQNLSKNLLSETLLQYRYSESSGKWVEAFPDWGSGVIPNDTLPNGQVVEKFRDYSYVSNTDWRTDNSSLLFRQRLFYKLKENMYFSGGLTFERKRLTKNYDIPGYYDAFGSSISSADTGPYGLGIGVYHSSDTEYEFAPAPISKMPASNLAFTNDLGGFVQGIYDTDKLRFNVGLRYDENTIYGKSWNPRGAIIWKMSKNNRLKLLYGEAFQEPAPIQLFGGFSGRNSNKDLEPEKGRNLELASMFYSDKLQFEVSAFQAWYNNVIKEDSRNAGKRNVFGVEGRFRYFFESPIINSKPISTYLYATYTRSKDEEYYDHLKAIWVSTPDEVTHEVGDIAPIKVQAGVNIPIGNIGVNLRSTYQSERELYQRNALKADGFTLESIFLLHGNVYLRLKNANISFRVNNILDNQYYHPGGEQADAGNDFDNRSSGFRNSLIPQPGRNFLINFTLGLF